MMQVRRHGPGNCMVLLHPVAANTRCCEQLENKIFTSIQIYSDVPHTGEEMTQNNTHIHRGEGGETTPTAGTTTGGGGGTMTMGGGA